MAYTKSHGSAINDEEEEERSKMHTGDLVFFCDSSHGLVLSKGKKYVTKEEKKGSEKYYDVPISRDTSFKKDEASMFTSNSKKDRDDDDDYDFPPFASYVFVQLQKSFVEGSLKPFLIAWMNSDDAQYGLTGELTNDTMVAFIYLRLMFKKELCREVKNACDIEDKPPETFSRLKENRCSYIWGLPLSQNILNKRDDINREDVDYDRLRTNKKIPTGAHNALRDYCFLGPTEDAGCRKLMAFDKTCYDSSQCWLKTRKVVDYSIQTSRVSPLTPNSSGSETCSTSLMCTTSTSSTTTIPRTPAVSRRSTSRGRSRKDGCRDKLKLSFETVLKRLHVYHGLICNFMLDRAYEFNYKKRCTLIYEASQPWFPPWCFYCCCVCNFDAGGGDFENIDAMRKSGAICYDPISNRAIFEIDSDSDNYKDNSEREYKKIYDPIVHAPWMTNEPVQKVFIVKSIHCILNFFDSIYVCRSLIEVYSNLDPSDMCWSVSEKIQRCNADASFVPLSSPSTEMIASQGVKEGSNNADSRETTPRSTPRQSNNITLPPAKLVKNESDIKIETMEKLPFTCMTSGRRVKKEDVMENIKTGLAVYRQNRTRSGIQTTRDMGHFSTAKSKELGIEFVISGLKDA